MDQKAIIVGLNLEEKEHFEQSMIELKKLCMACQYEVVGEVIQSSRRINVTYYIGSGKADELGVLVRHTEADVVIFNNELSPSQLKNFEGKIQCRVIDRTILILEIFAKRAKTREAKLQVEVAKLQYELPRLIGSNGHLGRQSGGIGTKNRGAGETKLELNRRMIEAKIADLNRELEALKSQRHVQRNKRQKSNIPMIALVGYTNAGKSSLMNEIIRFFNKEGLKQVLEKNMLFSTLETAVRKIETSDHKQFLLTDTVGFVSELPPELVKAFRSTLEEVCEADLLLHVIDISDEFYQQHMKVTEDTLNQIGAQHIPRINVYNKIDLVNEDVLIPDGVTISAKEGIGISLLVDFIMQQLFDDYLICDVAIPYHCGEMIAYISHQVEVLDVTYEEAVAHYQVLCSPYDYQVLKEYLI